MRIHLSGPFSGLLRCRTLRGLLKLQLAEHVMLQHSWDLHGSFQCRTLRWANPAACMLSHPCLGSGVRVGGAYITDRTECHGLCTDSLLLEFGHNIFSQGPAAAAAAFCSGGSSMSAAKATDSAQYKNNFGIPTSPLSVLLALRLAGGIRFASSHRIQTSRSFRPTRHSGMHVCGPYA